MKLFNNIAHLSLRPIPVNHPLHNPDPSYLRQLIDNIGKPQRQIAKDLDINESQFRAYLVHQHKRSHRPAPYLVQYALEKMACLTSSSDIDQLLHRVIELYSKHGISLTQIPKYTPSEFGLTLEVLNDHNKTLAQLTPRYINWLSESFGVKQEWLELGGRERIYPFNNDYKDSERLLNWLFNTQKEPNRIKAWAFNDVNKMDKRIPHFADGEAKVSLLFSEQVELTEGNFINRYRVSNPWDWNYSKSRTELKILARICTLRRLHFFCYTITNSALNELSNGHIFPEQLLNSLSGVNWHLDDYVHTADESVCAKDIDEIDKVIHRIETSNYKFFLEHEKS